MQKELFTRKELSYSGNGRYKAPYTARNRKKIKKTFQKHLTNNKNYVIIYM